MRARTACRGFTLIEIMVVVLIIGIVSAGVLLSVNLTGRDPELEKESDRLLALVNYAREQAELQTREYGVIFHDDGYQFVAYDVRRGLWREIYEDDSLRRRMLPDGLDFKLVVDARPVVLIPTGQDRKPDSKDKDRKKQQTRTLKDVTTLEDATSAKLKDSSGSRGGLGDDLLDERKKVAPQVMIFANGDLSSFEITVERDGGRRSVTLSQDEKGQVVAKPMVESRT